MFDLYKAIVELDAHANCKKRTCQECHELFNIDDCPSELYLDQCIEVLKILEKANDYAYDNGINLTEEDLVNLFIRS